MSIINNCIYATINRTICVLLPIRVSLYCVTHCWICSICTHFYYVSLNTNTLKTILAQIKYNSNLKGGSQFKFKSKIKIKEGTCQCF